MYVWLCPVHVHNVFTAHQPGINFTHWRLLSLLAQCGSVSGGSEGSRAAECASDPTLRQIIEDVDGSGAGQTMQKLNWKIGASQASCTYEGILQKGVNTASCSQ